MVHLEEGQKIFVQGSGKKPYEVKCSGGVISCDCPAWRNQKLHIDERTCKHIKANVSNGAASSVHSGSVVNGTANVVTSTRPKNVPPCLLAHTWDRVTDVTGWWCSFKLDGVRAWWDGKTFWSRLGNEYHAPQWFKDKMPKNVVFDGELFAGNGKFQSTVSFVRKLNPVDDDWKQVKFMVFDMPTHGGTFEDRMAEINKLVPNEGQRVESYVYALINNRVSPTDFGATNIVDAVQRHLQNAEKMGYEGIMLRQPGSLYVDGRSHTLLKIKSFYDLEVTVRGYTKGKGKYKGKIGALEVQMDNGKEFSVNLPDEEHKDNPPSIGSKVTIKYQKLSTEGIPQHLTFGSARDYE